MRQRRQWFEKFGGMYMALWWVNAGHIPSIAEAKQRLEYLQENGETSRAFTFKRTFPPTASEEESALVLPLNPCSAA